MILCRFGPLLFCHPPRQVDYIRCMDAEEYVQDFRFPLPGLDLSHGIMLFLCSERAFHCCGSDSGELLADEILLFLLCGRPPAADKGCLDTHLLAEIPVGCACIAGVSAYFLCIHLEHPFVHLDAVLKPRPLAEGVEGEFLDE